ncbi:unnamed protein product [Lactuca virosa]|uniref:Mediator complex subunit 15 KIX domain-containing protein n=1 Tax=Lactuca virosa TaxID=75947 RepID=A0AAU9N3W1_9ASTR|nr:unnamed protein product [Lactuca virosa]
MDTLKRHPRFSAYEGLYEFEKIAERFEEKIYAAATSQADYLRKIALKMLPMETQSQNTMPESNSVANSVNLSKGSQVMQQLNIQGQSPPIRVPFNHHQHQGQQLLTHTGMQAIYDSSMESSDWRGSAASRFTTKDRKQNVGMFRFLEMRGYRNLRKKAEMFEDNICTAATCQSDYLRKISLKMLTMETRSQNPMKSN